MVLKPEGKNCLEDLGVDGRIILKLVFKKWDECVDWIGLTQDREKWGGGGGYCECVDEHWASLKFGQFLERLRTY